MRKKVYLPEDLIVEILSRVPATSLIQFRTISKRWNALIKDGRFTNKHLANAPRPSLVIMLNNLHLSLVRVVHQDNFAPSVNITSQFSLKVDIRQVLHCDGLLLCVTKDNRLVVWNPCSGETRWIQARKISEKYDHLAFGKSSCNKYKIFRMNRSCVSAVWEAKCDVYDFSSDSWRSIGTIRDWSIDVMCGVFVKGYSYWLAVKRQQLRSFDFSEESFQSQPIPHSNLHNPVAAISVVREEQLCLLHYFADNTIDVWMGSKLDESSKGVMPWFRFLTIKSTRYMFSHGMSFFAIKEDKFVVCCDNTEVGNNNVLHILGEDRSTTVDYHGAKSSCSTLFSYVPTLVQIPQVI